MTEDKTRRPPMIRSGHSAKPDLTVAEFDRRADLLPDDPEGDLDDYLDVAKRTRPGRDAQNANANVPRGDPRKGRA